MCPSQTGYESIIVPNKPLFLVARGWMDTGDQNKRAWAGNFRPKSIYGLSVRTTPPGKRVSKNTELIRSVAHNSKAGSAVINKDAIRSKTRAERIDRAAIGSQVLPEPRLVSNGIPTMDAVKGFEIYIHYYPKTIATLVYPAECYLRVKTNPSRQVWFPLALQDPLLLKAFMWISAHYHALCDRIPEPGKLEGLFQSIVVLLNQRLRDGDTSEATMGAVSCLVIMENRRGNMSTANMHLKGLASMVRHRQKIRPLPVEYYSKIWKADSVHSADMLQKPCLPRPSYSTGYVKCEEPAASAASTLDILRSNDVIPSLVTISWTTQRLCWLVDHIWQRNDVLATEEFVSDILCAQHDLLNIQSDTNLGEAVRLALLLFTKPFIRTMPYTFNASRIGVSSLQRVLEMLEGKPVHPSLTLWLFFIGGIASRETVEKDWFDAKLVSIFKRHSYELEWNAVKNQLDQFLWTSAFHDKLGFTLYSELYRQTFPDQVV